MVPYSEANLLIVNAILHSFRIFEKDAALIYVLSYTSSLLQKATKSEDAFLCLPFLLSSSYSNTYLKSPLALRTVSRWHSRRNPPSIEGSLRELFCAMVKNQLRHSCIWGHDDRPLRLRNGNQVFFPFPQIVCEESHTISKARYHANYVLCFGRWKLQWISNGQELMWAAWKVLTFNYSGNDGCFCNVNVFFLPNLTDYTLQFVWRDVKKYIFRYLNICLTSKFGKLFDCTDRNAMVHRGACWINKLFPDYACVVSGIGSLYFMPHNHIRNYHPLHPRWFFPFDGCAALALNWSIQCLEISYRK